MFALAVILVYFFWLCLCPLQVKVMVRICPAKGARDTSESLSFLKVDAHKKQLTFCEPPASTPSNGGQKRFSSTSAPKTFNFDAVFTQDASQVSFLF